MNQPIDFARKEEERKARRTIFHTAFIVFITLLTCFLIWKLKSLLLPIVIGALMAYLFRPLKDRFQVPWIPHELRVLMLFAFVGMMLFVAFSRVKQMVPDEKEKLELKVRLKFKLNQKYQEITGANNPEKRAGAVAHVISHEFGPMMDQVNKMLALDPEEVTLFEQYRGGHKGKPPISDQFFEYFLANQTLGATLNEKRQLAEAAAGNTVATPEPKPADTAKAKDGLMEQLSIWILAPLMFIFLGFDNGQLRRYVIGLVPNRYFELSLQVMDMLDDAIGKYLRGTLIECALVGLTLMIGFFLLGIPFSVSLAIGVISGLANAIPFLGTVIGLGIALAYSLIAENIVPLIPGIASQDLALYIVALVGIAHLLDNVVFQPLVLGNAVNLHPLVVIVAIIGGSVMMGVFGMLLAIPTVVILKTAIETLFKELKDYKII